MSAHETSPLEAGCCSLPKEKLFRVHFKPDKRAQPAGLGGDFLAFRIGLRRGELGAKFLQFQLASASAGQLAAAFRARHQAISL